MATEKELYAAMVFANSDREKDLVWIAKKLHSPTGRQPGLDPMLSG